jgi:uncharacterized membrane protein YphA (DoxX/SURF4 family)
MVYGGDQSGEEVFVPGAKKLREAYSIGVKVIMAVVSGVFVISELQRIQNLGATPMNIAYLTLLTATVLLVGGWIVFLKKDIDAIADWLDPVAYQPPDEVVASVGLAVVLASLLLTARYVRLFGIVYVLYTTGNLIASAHLRREASVAIRSSRERVDEDRDKPELAASVAIYDKALDALERFLLDRPNLLRMAICVALAALGLVSAVYGHAARRQSVELIAYGIYIVSIIGPDVAVMMSWRFSLFSALRPLEAARYEMRRKQGASRASRQGQLDK